MVMREHAVGVTITCQEDLNEGGRICGRRGVREEVVKRDRLMKN